MKLKKDEEKRIACSLQCDNSISKKNNCRILIISSQIKNKHICSNSSGKNCATGDSGNINCLFFGNNSKSSIEIGNNIANRKITITIVIIIVVINNDNDNNNDNCRSFFSH